MISRRHLLPSAAALFAPAPPPNVLVILCDQLNASATSLYGGPVSTPHLERLARTGVVFHQATCPTPFCSPSRASIVTGLYPHTHGVVHNLMRKDYPTEGGPETEEGITRQDQTLDSLLNAAGYATHHYGKWHLSGDTLPYLPDMYREHHEYVKEMAPVFSQVRQRPREQWMDWYGWALPVTVAPAYREALKPVADKLHPRYSDFLTKIGRLDLPLDQLFDTRVADKTIARLQGKDSRPFLITCSFNLPHDPNLIPAPYSEMYPAARIQLPPNARANDPFFEKDLSRVFGAGEGGETRLREFLRVYYGSVRYIDDQVGRVLRALEESGQADRTIVVFTSDHGDMAGGHGMMWKSTQSFYQEVARVPMIVRAPGRTKAGRSDAQVSLVDLAPTLLELTGQRATQPMDGVSFASLLNGGSSSKPQFSQRICERVQPNPQRTRKLADPRRGAFMIQTGEFKYARQAGGYELLFDRRRDPGETTNLAGEGSRSAIMAHLRAELDKAVTMAR